MCLADIHVPRLEDAAALEQRARLAADACTQEQLALATLLTMLANMIRLQREVINDLEVS